MRICLCSSQFYPVVGGVPQVSDTLADYWVSNGHQVTVVTDNSENEKGYYCGVVPRDIQYSVVRVPTTQDWNNILNACDLVVSNGVSVKYLSSWVRSRKPIVWIHQIYQQTLLESILRPRRFLRWMTVKLALRIAVGNVFISQAVAKQVNAARGVVIYNPIDRKFRVLGDEKAKFNFGFFGRVQREKGVDILIHALKVCRSRGFKFSLCVYGDGTERDSCIFLADQLGVSDSIAWFPFAQDGDLVCAMNSVEVVVVPSRWAEPMGIVAPEAMACGCAVIGSNAGGLGEVLHGFGMTFGNGCVLELAARMIEIFSESGCLEKVRQKCLVRSKHFSIDRIGMSYLNFFKSIVD